MYLSGIPIPRTTTHRAQQIAYRYFLRGEKMQCLEAQYPANGGLVDVVEHMTTHEKKSH